MNNIWKIFTGDLKRLRTNVIAWVIILGITVVPSLYAWFNIAASWDPYGNTGNLKIAVANTDQGYTGKLLPIQLNIGDIVIARLHENTKMKWTFTDQDDAIEGVKSGKYYAAVVIPDTFSNDMMSLFSDEVHETNITYYLNQKANAIAPKITDKGTGIIQRGIREEFTTVVTEISLNILSDLSDSLDEEEKEGMTDNFLANLEKIEGSMSASAATIRAFSTLVDSLDGMLSATSDFMTQSGDSAVANVEKLSLASQDFSGVTDDVSGITASINTSIAALNTAYQEVNGQIAAAVDSLETDTAGAAAALSGIDVEVQSILTASTNVRDSLQGIRDQLEVQELPTGAADALLDRLNASIASQQALDTRLQTAASTINEAASEAGTAGGELQAKSQAALDNITSMQSTYEDGLQSSLTDLFNQMQTTEGTVNTILTDLQAQTSAVSDTAADASADLKDLKAALDGSAESLEQADKKLTNTIASIRTAMASGDGSTLQAILSSDPSSVANFLSAPVALNTQKLFPVENYGSAMAPFYSTLAIWVGATVMVAMMLVEVAEDRKKELTAGGKKLRNYQLYLGRHLIFTLIGLAQATLICLGDLYFLKIQCQHPLLFLFAGWVTSLVYTNIIYTLTVSFGDVGKAVCVILMVIQVAGSGGTFPIEMTPPIFQKIYPLLPFAHSMDAMRECIAGFYGNYYWMQLGYLCLFSAAALILGLLLRTPIIHLNHLFTEKLESTKLI